VVLSESERVTFTIAVGREVSEMRATLVVLGAWESPRKDVVIPAVSLLVMPTVQIARLAVCVFKEVWMIRVREVWMIRKKIEKKKKKKKKKDRCHLQPT
jgi:hypothetical protein